MEELLSKASSPPIRLGNTDSRQGFPELEISHLTRISRGMLYITLYEVYIHVDNGFNYIMSLNDTTKKVSDESSEVEKLQELGDEHYLESPKSFLLEMPLYRKFKIPNTDVIKKVFKLLTYYGTIDMYCTYCKKDSVFDTTEYVNCDIGIWRRDYINKIDSHRFRCSRDSSHVYFVYHITTDTTFMKIGQLPSVADFQIPQAEKYRKILGENSYLELTKGIGLKAHGVGIGSFVYLRRIFERLIEEAFIKASENKEIEESTYLTLRMADKIQALKKYLPSFLVEHSEIYNILSLGLHALDEQTCLSYFDSLKYGIELILDEKIIDYEREEKRKLGSKSIKDILTRLDKHS